MPLDNPLNERVKAKKLHCNKGKKRNIGRKKVMKKNILVILSILIITILSGCQKKEEVSTYEQDRVAQYILDNVELIDGSEINKIKFMQYEKNVSTQIWSIGVEINEKILVLIKENKKNSEIWISSSNEKINITKRNKLYKKGSIEIIYIEGKE